MSYFIPSNDMFNRMSCDTQWMWTSLWLFGRQTVSIPEVFPIKLQQTWCLLWLCKFFIFNANQKTANVFSISLKIDIKIIYISSIIRKMKLGLFRSSPQFSIFIPVINQYKNLLCFVYKLSREFIKSSKNVE